MFQWIKRLFGSKSAATPAPASPNLPSASTMSFTVEPPLTSFDERKVFTPNKGSKVIIPSAVVLHHSDGSYRGGVEWIATPASKVSYHVLIARDGRRTARRVDDDVRRLQVTVQKSKTMQHGHRAHGAQDRLHHGRGVAAPRPLVERRPLDERAHEPQSPAFGSAKCSHFGHTEAFGIREKSRFAQERRVLFAAVRSTENLERKRLAGEHIAHREYRPSTAGPKERERLVAVWKRGQSVGHARSLHESKRGTDAARASRISVVTEPQTALRISPGAEENRNSCSRQTTDR